MSLASLKYFKTWFTSQGGSFDTSLISFTEFAEGGRGVIALQDIPEGASLFKLPRSLVLSTRTSNLPTIIREEWQKYQLGKGWVGLILCMLWEEGREDSKWSGYFEGLPRQFETPMFWSEEELKQLEGTAVYDKIGKRDAERVYVEKIVPIVKSRPDIFVSKNPEQYSLENYHRMGSLILSRSFHVEQYEKGHNSSEEDEDGSEEKHLEGETSINQGTVIEVDEEENPSNLDTANGNQEEMEETPSDNENEDDENSEDVAMVPFADILNAKYGSSNAKLFYEEKDLGMITIRGITRGEQIWNTYGDPPNSDLLRRYGHIDLVILADGSLGNPADIVEVRADLVVKLCRISEGATKERIEWWLEEGGDDVFIFDRSLKPPEHMISFIRLLQQTPSEWATTRDKTKLPKPRMDARVADICKCVLQERLKEYPTTLQADEESLVNGGDSMTCREKAAIHVRAGEKRILMGALGLLQNQKTKSSDKEAKRKAFEHPRKDQSIAKRFRH